MNEAVVTVPSFFNQAERRSLARAAELAGIKLLQLMNDNAAGLFSQVLSNEIVSFEFLQLHSIMEFLEGNHSMAQLNIICFLTLELPQQQLP